MQVVTIRLVGEYWDSYLYNDQLFLLSRDGVLEIYRWDELVNELAEETEFDTELRHLITRGRAWYGLAVQNLIHGTGVRAELVRAVNSLALEPFVLSRRVLRRHLKMETEVEGFPSTDIEVFGNQMFVGSTDGVFATPLARVDEIDLSRSAILLDTPAVKLSASYNRLAIAHGADGLSDLAIGKFELLYEHDPREHKLISTQRCDSCSWASFDIVASAAGSGGYVNAFSKPIRDEPTPQIREKLGTVGSSDLFGIDDGFLVGAGNLLVLAREGELWTESWNPYRRREDFGIDVAKITSPALMARQTTTTEPIDAAVTVFGTVLELDERLVVYRSDGKQQTLDGEPISWRVFPRSQRYLNHLHVVREDRLDILAFTHDYFQPSQHRSLAMSRPTANVW